MKKLLISLVVGLGAFLTFLAAESYSQETLKEAAREPFEKGLAAAQQQDFLVAIRYFEQAHKADDLAAQIWFNLGLASSKAQGRELRALAWWKTFLKASPDAPNAKAVRDQVSSIDLKIESTLGKLIPEYVALVRQLRESPRYASFAVSYQVRLATVIAMLGDAKESRRIIDVEDAALERVEGDWLGDWGRSLVFSDDMDGARRLHQRVVGWEALQRNALGAESVPVSRARAQIEKALVQKLVDEGKFQDAKTIAERIPAHFEFQRYRWLAIASIVCGYARNKDLSAIEQVVKQFGEGPVWYQMAFIPGMRWQLTGGGISGLREDFGASLASASCPAWNPLGDRYVWFGYTKPLRTMALQGVSLKAPLLNSVGDSAMDFAPSDEVGGQADDTQLAAYINAIKAKGLAAHKTAFLATEALYSYAELYWNITRCYACGEGATVRRVR